MYIEYILTVNAVDNRACLTTRPELVGGGSLVMRKGMMPTDSSLDVRQVVPRERHPLVFSTFEVLKAGEGFILIADHDPRPLRRQFETQCADQFSWDYLEQGPAVWRVRIGRQP
jgi:uncharacterized protein (DUF2249 family)